MCAILAVIVWHIVVVVRQRQWPDAVAYIASRVLLLAFLGGSAVALRLQGVDMHLHHLYLGELGGSRWLAVQLAATRGTSEARLSQWQGRLSPWRNGDRRAAQAEARLAAHSAAAPAAFSASALHTRTA